METRRTESGHIIKILPKKPGQKGRTEVHCMEDACIFVNVPSDTGAASIDSELEEQPFTVSGESSSSLVQYALSKAIEQTEREAEDNHELDWEDNHYSYDDDQSDADSSSVKQKENSLEENCSVYLDPVSYAKQMVDQVIYESKVITAMNKEEEDNDDRYKSVDYDNNEIMMYDVPKSFVNWPTVEQFSVEKGAYTIDEYLSSSDTEEDWIYVIYYEGVEETKWSDLHRYQAIYSLPTWKYPIAQATASIFFTIEVCKLKPPGCLVDVTYNYETFRQKYKPGIIDFQEKWLHYILDAKIKLFQTVTY